MAADTTALPALIERLEQAPEGSRELDYEIFLLDSSVPEASQSARELASLLPRPMPDHAGFWPTYTTSIDAAITLVPEGAWVRIEHRREHQTGEKLCNAGFDLNRAPYAMYAQAKTFPLALCSAALKSRVKG